MNWIGNIKDVFSIKALVLAAGIWISGMSLLYFMLVAPQSETIEDIKEELNELNETRFLVKTAKMDSIMLTLQDDINHFTHDERRLENQAMQLQQVPLYVSKILKSASENGLETNNSGLFNSISEDNPNKTIKINLKGKYQQMLDFLQEINSWNKMVRVKNFSLNQTVKEPEFLLGIMEIVVDVSQ